MFLDRVRTLISLGGRTVSVRASSSMARPDLPEGCSVDVEIGAIDMLRRFLPAGAGRSSACYRELRESRDARPAAAEMARPGYTVPRTLRQTHGGWFDFVATRATLDAPRDARCSTPHATGSASSRDDGDEQVHSGWSLSSRCCSSATRS